MQRDTRPLIFFSKMNLTIRRENLPVRCEICHQTDLFDPETGECVRCSAVSGQFEKKSAENSGSFVGQDFRAEFGQIRKRLTRLHTWLLIVVIVLAIGLFANDMASFAAWLLIGFNLFSVFLTAVFEKCPACNRRTPGLRENWFGKQRSTCRHCEAILLNPDGTVFKD